MKKWKILILITAILSISFVAQAASVDIKLDVKFASGKDVVNSYGVDTLRQLQDVFGNFPNSKILISGHTDSLGSDEYNEGLSVNRALSVKKKLVFLGVDKERIETKGFGETAPIADNTNRMGRAENRRVVGSLLGLTNEEAKKIPYIISSSGFERRLEVLETESDVVTKYKEDLEPVVVEEEPVVEAVIEEPVVVEEKVVARKGKKKKRRWYVAGYIGPHWDSTYYGDDIIYEHGKFTFLTLGVDAGFKLSKRWFVDGYLYYLPTQVNQGTSPIIFNKGKSVKYENNIYGLRAGYIFKGGKSYRLSAIGGLTSHIIGGVERSGANDYDIQKFTHFGLALGLRWEQRLSKKWAFDSDLAYLFPLSVSGVGEASGKLWYRGILGVKRKLTQKFILSLEYQAVYHESDFKFAAGYKTRPEFFIQTVMAGLKYNF